MTNEVAHLTGLIECHFTAVQYRVPFVGIAANTDKSETYLSHLHVKKREIVTDHFSVQTLAHNFPCISVNIETTRGL
jgi:hypothetical protein